MKLGYTYDKETANDAESMCLCYFECCLYVISCFLGLGGVEFQLTTRKVEAVDEIPD